MQDIKQEKSQIKQNILLYLDKIGVSPYEFYKNSGVTRGVLSQNNGISEDNITRFLAYAPEVNVEWLLTGRGVMIKGSRNEDVEPPVTHTIETQPLEDNSNTNTILELVAQITQQAETIGELKERIRQLERERGQNASGATSIHANVG